MGVANRGPESQRCARAKITYIKLASLSEEEIGSLEVDRRNTKNRRLFDYNDAHGPLFLYRAVGEEKLRREIEPYRHTDFSRLYREMGAGDILFHLGDKGRLTDYDLSYQTPD